MPTCWAREVFWRASWFREHTVVARDSEVADQCSGLFGWPFYIGLSTFRSFSSGCSQSTCASSAMAVSYISYQGGKRSYAAWKEADLIFSWAKLCSGPLHRSRWRKFDRPIFSRKFSLRFVCNGGCQMWTLGVQVQHQTGQMCTVTSDCSRCPGWLLGISFSWSKPSTAVSFLPIAKDKNWGHSSDSDGACLDKMNVVYRHC